MDFFGSATMNKHDFSTHNCLDNQIFVWWKLSHGNCAVATAIENTNVTGVILK